MFAPCVLADYAGTFDASDRAEVRGRVQNVAPSPALDLADVLTGALALRGRRWEYSLDYSAQFILGDVELGGFAEVLQTAGTRAVWHERNVRLAISEYAQYGEESAAYLLANPSATAPSAAAPTGTPPAVQLLAAPRPLLYLGSTSSLDAEFTIDRRWLATSLVQYAIDGGANADSRAALPLIRGPLASVSAVYQGTRVDTFETRLQAARVDTTPALCYPTIITQTPGETCAPTGESAELAEIWRHRLTRTAQTSLGGGVSYVQARLRPEDPYDDFIYPVAFASFEQMVTVPADRSVLHVDAELMPVVDGLTGGVDERVQGRAAFSVPVQRFLFTGSASASQSVDSPFTYPATFFDGGIEADYRADKQVDFGAGLRASWQNQDPIGSFWGLEAYVQVTVRAPQTKF